MWKIRQSYSTIGLTRSGSEPPKSNDLSEPPVFYTSSFGKTRLERWREVGLEKHFITGIEGVSVQGCVGNRVMSDKWKTFIFPSHWSWQSWPQNIAILDTCWISLFFAPTQINLEKNQLRSNIMYTFYWSSDAAAPVIISTSSPVITACRVRLNRIWNFVIISPAFFEALSMALRRADCSQAWPSASAYQLD